MKVCPDCGASYAAADLFCQTDGSELAESIPDPLLGETVGSYRVTRVLGTGGMGRVYLAVHPAIGSRVAIKVLSPDCARRPDLVDRFFAEARAVNHIRHEGIVNILDLASLPDGRPYIIMEYLDGYPLSAFLGVYGALPLGSSSQLAIEILDALAAAHEKGVIHRDLKPDNIFVTPHGRPKVLDFGIAKLLPEFGGGEQARATQTGMVLGTPSYMAPEQITGGAIGPWSDLYAMGVILFEAATGTAPFSGESLFELFTKHVTEPVAPPSRLRPDIPPDLDRVIVRAMAKDPRERFRSAAEMATALADATRGLPPHAWAALVSSRTGATARPPGLSAAPTPPDVGATTERDVGAPTELEPMPGAFIDTPRVPDSAPGVHRAAAAQVTPRGGSGRAAGIAVVAGLLVAGLVAGGIWLGQRGSRAQASSDPGDNSEDAVVATGATGDTAAGSRASDRDTAPAETSATDRSSATGSGDSADGARPGGGGGATVAAPAPSPSAATAASPSTSPPVKTQQPTATPTSNASPVDGRFGKGGEPDAGPPAAVAPADPTAGTKAKKRFTIKPDFDTRKFDAIAFLPRAQKLAREIMSDAFLVQFDVEAVYPSGLADLRFGSATFEFRSPSRSARPTDVPDGVEIDIECMVYVEVSLEEIEVFPTTREVCDRKKRPTPRCSLAQVWEKAVGAGARNRGNVVATINYLWDGWTLGIGDSEFYESFPDDCR